jgi:hypothetical protein
MEYSEAERKKLIKKLKTVKDARERDRIIWALAGHEEKAFETANPTAQPGAQSRTALGKPMDLQNLPQLAIDAKRLIGFAVPGFFLIFGVAYIIQAILGYLASQRIETEITRLFMGGIFIVVGLVGIFKALRSGEKPPGR